MEISGDCVNDETWEVIVGTFDPLSKISKWRKTQPRLGHQRLHCRRTSGAGLRPQPINPVIFALSEKDLTSRIFSDLRGKRWMRKVERILKEMYIKSRGDEGKVALTVPIAASFRFDPRIGKIHTFDFSETTQNVDLASPPFLPQSSLSIQRCQKFTQK